MNDAGRFTRRTWWVSAPTLHVMGLIIGCMVIAAVARGEEIHSNGTGGGNWSDAETWHGGKVPAADDVAVIAMRDSVVFDGNDAGRTTCKQLYLDPESVLSFKAGEAKCTFTVAGLVESYGTIKIDASEAIKGAVEFRLAGPTDDERTIRLMPNGALLVYGNKELPAEGRNITFTTPQPQTPAAGTPEAPALPAPPHVLGKILADSDVMLDLQYARLIDVGMEVRSIDNTGAKANQRLNVIGNSFNGICRMYLATCDTPAVRGNRFDCGKLSVGQPAILLDSCKLGEVKGNRVSGAGYAVGIQIQNDVDSTAIDNVIDGCARGLHWHGRTAMMKGNKITNCAIGLSGHTATGVVEDTTIDGSKVYFEFYYSTMQFTNCHIGEVAKDGCALSLNQQAGVTLLNCNIPDDKIKLDAVPPPVMPWVASMQFLQVKVSGRYPEGSVVEVKTADVSGGAAAVAGGKTDLNVRNSPAHLNEQGLTAPPRAQTPLVVAGWSIGADKKTIPAPYYDVSVIGPGDGKTPGKLLKSVRVAPTDKWQCDPTNPAPTLEVTVP